MEDSAITIHCLPGLGADHRLFVEQMRGLENCLCPPLPPPGDSKTLRDYGKEWLKGVEWNHLTLFIGFSFGGMVALEALASVEVPHDKVLGLVILSGCRSRRAITQEFKKNVTLMHLAPKPLLRSQLRRIARTFSPNDPLTDEQRDLLVEMADEIDLDLLRWGAAACAKWDYEGPEKTGFPFPVYQIHGSEDDVIPLVEGDPDFVIPGGGHMIQYAHSAEINRLIELRRDAWLAERSGS